MLASWHVWGERFLNSLLLGLYTCTCTMIIDISLYFSRYFMVEKFPLIMDSICLISFKCFSNMTRCFFIIYVIFFFILTCWLLHPLRRHFSPCSYIHAVIFLKIRHLSLLSNMVDKRIPYFFICWGQ